MRVVRYRAPDGPASYGLAEGEEIQPLKDAPWLAGGVPVPAGGPIPRRDVTLLPPCQPGKILGIGRNYHAHARELGNEVPKEPLVFLKPSTSLVAHKGAVVLPKDGGRVDYEGELAAVVGRRARNVPPGSWRDVIYGFTVGIDVTSRDLQKKDGQWWRAKGFDTFCPLGPAVETEVDPSDLLLQTLVDGVTRQSGRTSQMIFDLGVIVAFLSAAMTLEPGDVILTGTPEGVAPLVAGQTVEVRIERVGALSVRVEAE